jgi:hypothetical protein
MKAQKIHKFTNKKWKFTYFL